MPYQFHRLPIFIRTYQSLFLDALHVKHSIAFKQPSPAPRPGSRLKRGSGLEWKDRARARARSLKQQYRSPRLNCTRSINSIGFVELALYASISSSRFEFDMVAE